MKSLCLAIIITVAGVALGQPYQPTIIWDRSGETDTSGYGRQILALGDQNNDGFMDAVVTNEGTDLNANGDRNIIVLYGKSGGGFTRLSYDTGGTNVAQDVRLPVEEGRSWASFIALSGQQMMISDDPSAYDEPRLDILRRVGPTLFSRPATDLRTSFSKAMSGRGSLT